MFAIKWLLDHILHTSVCNRTCRELALTVDYMKYIGTRCPACNTFDILRKR